MINKRDKTWMPAKNLKYLFYDKDNNLYFFYSKQGCDDILCFRKKGRAGQIKGALTMQIAEKWHRVLNAHSRAKCYYKAYLMIKKLNYDK